MSQYTSLSPANEKAWHWHELYQGWLSLAEAHRKETEWNSNPRSRHQPSRHPRSRNKYTPYPCLILGG